MFKCCISCLDHHVHGYRQAWDLALDLCLRQLPKLLEDELAVFQHSPFFTEQLTAFDVWLKYGAETRAPPEQLPIVLQVLLSQVHRLRALELLGRFLDLGPWAVSLVSFLQCIVYNLHLSHSMCVPLDLVVYVYMYGWMICGTKYTRSFLYLLYTQRACFLCSYL